MTNITSALSAFTGALSAYEAAKADLHKAHLSAENACTDGVSGEASAALTTSGAASQLGFSALSSELALLDLGVGVGKLDKDGAAARVAALDAAMKTFEAARVALDKARAALDTAFDGERTRALAVRAKLSGIAGEAKKS